MRLRPELSSGEYLFIRSRFGTAPPACPAAVCLSRLAPRCSQARCPFRAVQPSLGGFGRIRPLLASSLSFQLGYVEQLLTHYAKIIGALINILAKCVESTTVRRPIADALELR